MQIYKKIYYANLMALKGVWYKFKTIYTVDKLYSANVIVAKEEKIIIGFFFDEDKWYRIYEFK